VNTSVSRSCNSVVVWESASSLLALVVLDDISHWGSVDSWPKTDLPEENIEVIVMRYRTVGRAFLRFCGADVDQQGAHKVRCCLKFGQSCCCNTLCGKGLSRWNERGVVRGVVSFPSVVWETEVIMNSGVNENHHSASIVYGRDA
jgi:hypothetical protein